MIKRVRLALLSLFALVAISGGVASVVASPVAAQVDVFKQCTNNQVGNSAICQGNGKLFGPGSLWNRILNMLTFLIGAAAVIMIVVGGMRYVLSNGDPTAAASAKNTIIYAVIGLVVAASANAIVNFVLTNI